GLAGLFGYGLNRTLEARVPADRFDEFPSPKLALGVYDWVVSFDHETRRAWLVSTGFADGDIGPEWERHVQAEYRQGEILKLLRSRGSAPLLGPARPGDLPASSLCPQYPLPG